MFIYPGFVSYRHLFYVLSSTIMPYVIFGSSGSYLIGTRIMCLGIQDSIIYAFMTS